MKPLLSTIFPELPGNISKNFTAESIKISKKYRSVELIICEDITDIELDRLESSIKDIYNLSTVHIRKYFP